MSNLSHVEKMIFVELFNMKNGYVLEFESKNKFAEFFRSTVNCDIYSKKYSQNGDSMAKRLRAFWEIEQDDVVAILLSELLELWQYNAEKGTTKKQPELYENAKCIVDKLKVRQPNYEQSEREFLIKNFDNINIEKLDLEEEILTLLESRLNEVKMCINASAPLATIFMCGSILEGMLLGMAMKNPMKFNQALSTPKKNDGKPKEFNNWNLSEFISVAHELQLIGKDVNEFSNALRNFRNYIHPHCQLKQNFKPDMHTATISFQVLKAAIADLLCNRQ